MIKLAIGEDHQSLIDGISLLLAAQEEIKLICTANDGEDLVNQVLKYQPDVVITDIRMPKMDGIEATKLIKKQLPDTGIIAFSMFDQTEAIRQMLDAGASGYVLKNSSLETLKKAIKKVASGETYFDSQIDLSLIETDDFNDEKGGLLTKRQVEILRHIALGKTSREIADELFIGVHTVDTHRKNMMRILELKGKGELLRYALERKYDF
ncbi:MULTISPECIES: response regulator transcription factor [unclassified Leeuwenhoekiella]|uniref:response regulator n=1 Tax=unclassified Leeuwenhoekiella TaxID=2615029 RepID=UPI000C3B772A|nr:MULTISPECIES: response regulator transcription factor [unclassified Leeuwenhoekiella]MAW94194.1 DNA-binding response regulator [Leeuwenhoekiella sp.]MAW96248.1 DNA-binding response regulator [Leeuwenhoekiella sp.]MBA80242.1 DNA-binding response regulator [Leeuwenhoekiella sp.]|tara:strand:- start:28173 stop:28799 length:627 start_codon:yes stop_codon:yes gene_type:complete